jgi:hypothetical protein
MLAMEHPKINDVVTLLQDVPDLALARGQRGVVRSTWFSPFVAYEVGFQPRGLDCQTRALLLSEQIEVDWHNPPAQSVPVA